MQEQSDAAVAELVREIEALRDRLRSIDEAAERLTMRSIFGNPARPPALPTCFYLGPFAEPFDTIYKDHVVPALRSAGLGCSRADAIFSTEPVISDIWLGISAATLIVADMTGKNGNVLYEVGVAHAIGKPVILLTQDISEVPFDLRHRRCIRYDYTPRGCKLLEAALVRTAESVLELDDQSRASLSSPTNESNVEIDIR
jgi:hypothetical protein